MEPKKHEPKLKLVCNFRFFFAMALLLHAIENGREMMLISRFVFDITGNALLLSAMTFDAISI